MARSNYTSLDAARGIAMGVAAGIALWAVVALMHAVLS